MDVNVILQKLNSDQIKPVLDTEGAVLVIAGAGSGKTRVLTSRIAYLILEKGIEPSRIMAITFTNKAAKEMKDRIEKIVGSATEMWVSTIHSMCVKILRRDIEKIGYDKNFTIYDETDKDKALKRIFEELGLETDKFLKIAKYHISNAKNECLYPEEYKKANIDVKFIDDICAVYQAYERQLNRSNSLDFDDLLFKTWELFCKFPEVADYYANKFEYIHIDEFQDTNTVQFAIAKRLASCHGNIFVVGDDDQSIYGWRGAKIENILEFDKQFLNAKVYKLEQNYRSTKKILDLANCIIANNTGRREKELWTENADGVRIETFVATDENSEASYVAMQIKSLMARLNLKYSDFAVFMRVNAISRAFEQELTKYAIPYKVYGGFKFFDRKEIKDVLSYLKVVNNIYDDESFLRSIVTPKRGIGETTLREFREFCASREKSLYEGLSILDLSSLSSATKKKLYNYKLLLDSFIEYSKEHNAFELMDYVLKTTLFLEQFEEKNEENQTKLLNISELKNTAELFIRENVGSTLADYLNSVTLSTDTDDINTEDFVTLATIHASKGLEFKVVFVTGLDEKILPLERTFNDEEEMEEERRLMYVAITRAKERLYLTRANSRYLYGRRDYMRQSRFLKEGQAVLGALPSNRTESLQNSYNDTYRGVQPSRLTGDKYSGYGNFNDQDYGYSSNSSSGYSSNYARKFLEANKPKENKIAGSVGYKSGMKVRHVKFGVGTVIAVRGNGENTVVDVAFVGVGIKALAVKYAPLEIV